VVVAAFVAVALLLVLIVFQLALAAGAPLGAAAWGGQNRGVLPGRLRVASALVGLVLYPVLGAVILASAGVIGDDWLPIDPSIAIWILAAFFALGVVANGISRSPAERIWAVVSAAIAVCCVVIALG
jgi:hypothetical protein